MSENLMEQTRWLTGKKIHITWILPFLCNCYSYKIQLQATVNCRAMWRPKYCKNGVLCVVRCHHRQVGLRPSLTNRTLGHCGHWILSWPNSSAGRASALKTESPVFNSQLVLPFRAYTHRKWVFYTHKIQRSKHDHLEVKFGICHRCLGSIKINKTRDKQEPLVKQYLCEIHTYKFCEFYTDDTCLSHWDIA